MPLCDPVEGFMSVSNLASMTLPFASTSSFATWTVITSADPGDGWRSATFVTSGAFVTSPSGSEGGPVTTSAENAAGTRTAAKATVTSASHGRPRISSRAG